MKEELKYLINSAFEAVDQSKFGPMIQYPDECDVTKKNFNQLAFGVFTIVLTGILKNRSFDNERA